jgi:serpin B
MKAIKTLLISLTMIFAVACKTKAPEKSVATTTTNISKPDPSMIARNNQFAFDLYKNISQKPENLFYSPFSISAALGMTYTGSKGNTEKQIADVMNFAANDAAFYNNYQAYLHSINKLNNDTVSIYTANSFWAQVDFKFKKEFVEIIRNHFSGEIKNVDFIKEAEKCRLEINKWVEVKTNNKIENLIKPGLIDDLTRLVLVNAIYFKAPWEMPFNEKATKKMDFKTDETSVVSTDFMTAENNYKYYTEEDFSAIEIPYKKGSLSMLIILPSDNNSFKALNKNISNAVYDKINSALVIKKVKLTLPKFKATCEFELSDVLKSMGMQDAFTDKADFSGMTGKKDLKISKVVHKSFINVDEAGTEAAAATAVIIRIKSVPMNVVEFKADHPFMFIIRENTGGSILFAGNVYNPTK